MIQNFGFARRQTFHRFDIIGDELFGEFGGDLLDDFRILIAVREHKSLGYGLLIGADIEASESTQKESAGVAEVKAGRDLYAGGRISFAVSPTANLYVKGGYTNARFKADDGVDSFARNFDGYRLGAGGQLAIRGKAYVGAEYRYSNYEQGLSRNQVALTLGTRF